MDKKINDLVLHTQCSDWLMNDINEFLKVRRQIKLKTHNYLIIVSF